MYAKVLSRRVTICDEELEGRVTTKLNGDAPRYVLNVSLCMPCGEGFSLLGLGPKSLE